ncbi:DUF1840 family protein [Granulosicoccaceae sp. 1_MG-2023]|nr:DUF1840 family protein [Granulosicoccaceae sp. 1_MG-2023]
MLVKFKTGAGFHSEYLEGVAHDLLKLMGLSGHIPGALEKGDLAAHLEKLKVAVSAEPVDGEPFDDDAPSMKARAKPLMDLIEGAIRDEDYLMWDYKK